MSRGPLGLRDDGRDMLFNSYSFAFFFAMPLPRLLASWPAGRGSQNSLLLPRATISTRAGTPGSSRSWSLDGDGFCLRTLGRPHRGSGTAQGLRRAEHGAQPGHAGLFQVLQLLRREPADRPGPAGSGSIPLSQLEVVLPIGISFYTFQSMSYVIDVYRHESSRRGTSSSSRPSSRSSRTWSPARSCGRRRSCRRSRTDGGSTSSSSTRVLSDLLGPAEKVVVADNLAANRQRPVRPLADDRRRPGPAGDLRLRVPDLLRLLGLHRHRPRRRQVPGLRAGA